MTTIKSYTDIEQSKKLAKILPLDSADMIYIMFHNGEKPQNGDENLSTVYESNEHKWYWIDIIDEAWNMRIGEDIPCWSLAALLSVLPMITKDEDTANPFIAKTPDGEYYVVYATLTKEVYDSSMYDNPVDACVSMVEKLHELNLL